MKNTLLFLLALLLSFSCSGLKSKSKSKEKGFGTAQKTADPNTPYIYKNGFLNYNILQIPIIQKNDTITLNELRFNAVFSAYYTQKVMYDKFGKWTKEIRPNNELQPILVWENIKLFENQNKLFSVYANGDENLNEIYASVLVYDDEANDCLEESNILKEKIINYFSKGIQNLNDNDEFYGVYSKSLNEYKKTSTKK